MQQWHSSGTDGLLKAMALNVLTVRRGNAGMLKVDETGARSGCSVKTRAFIKVPITCVRCGSSKGETETSQAIVEKAILCDQCKEIVRIADDYFDD